MIKKLNKKIVIKREELNIPNELHKQHIHNYKGAGAQRNKKKYYRPQENKRGYE